MSALNNWFRGVDLARIIEWLMFALAALLSISVHESSHALSAYWLGDDTAKRMGRVSLNPLRHLDVVGFLMMVIAHFGWARPVPVNPYRMKKLKSPKLGMALTAAAGPISNLLLALLSAFCFLLLFYAGWAKGEWELIEQLNRGFAGGSGAGWSFWLGKLLGAFLTLNAGLAVFNLLPISPLDGSKVLAIVLPQKVYVQLMRYERYGMFLLIALLFVGVLDGPLSTLVTGLIRGLISVAEPLARLLTGAAS